jgi:hypothetical protein
MIKNLGLIFSGLLILLLLSNIHYNTGFQVLGQNNTSPTSNNNSETAVSPTTPDTTNTVTSPTAPSTVTKLSGGVKINSPGNGDLVPLNSNKSLVIFGVSKDNATSDCDVTIIVNNVKPYQNVQPTGIQGNSDYSTWQYTLASNYTSINEGNNKITSKIYCTAGTSGGASQAYYSVNVTASNFTQAQLANYELMLQSAANATNAGAGGNSTLGSSNATQPVAQIQQFNQDTGSGPVCCTTVGGTIPGQTTGTTSPTAAVLADDTPEVTPTEEEEEEVVEEVEEENTEEESNNNEETEEESNNNEEEDNDNDDNDNDSSRDIMDDVEDTLRESGIDMDL